MTRPSIDHSLLSPYGKCSKRAREAMLRREAEADSFARATKAALDRARALGRDGLPLDGRYHVLVMLASRAWRNLPPHVRAAVSDPGGE